MPYRNNNVLKHRLSLKKKTSLQQVYIYAGLANEDEKP